MNKKQILIGSDHAGFTLKKKILLSTLIKTIDFIDIGTTNEDSVDYPDFAHLLSQKLNKKDYEFVVLICGTGIGMSMVANRYKNVRAALCLNEKMSKLAREHNNANLIVLGSRLISEQLAIKCLKCFFSENFAEGRHKFRLKKFNNILD